MRVTAGDPVTVALVKYSPFNPVPALPTMMLTVPGSDVVRSSMTWKVKKSGPV